MQIRYNPSEFKDIKEKEKMAGKLQELFFSRWRMHTVETKFSNR
jgi:hypothetical protein